MIDIVDTKINDLAHLIVQRHMNERVYKKNIIPTYMYEYAKKELQKQIDILEKICYTRK